MTVFMVRDRRVDDIRFRRVKRETYKKMVRIHDEAGQPFKVGTEYLYGVPTKKLTLL
jgi:hypothetical protein